MSQSIAFFGASTGIGLAALKQALAANHTVIALCRNPDRLSSSLPASLSTTNLHLKKGNAHDVTAVAECLLDPRDATGKSLVNTICFSIGGVMSMSSFKLDDPDVCKKGIRAVLQAVRQLRDSGCAGAPLIVAVSSTGISKFGRDIPLAMVPLYHIMLKQPHADKRVMEEVLSGGGERYVLVRPSFLTDGEAGKSPVRVAVEDLQNGLVKKEVGYTISREETGVWMYQNLLAGDLSDEYLGKAVSLTW